MSGTLNILLKELRQEIINCAHRAYVIDAKITGTEDHSTGKSDEIIMAEWDKSASCILEGAKALIEEAKELHMILARVEGAL